MQSRFVKLLVVSLLLNTGEAVQLKQKQHEVAKKTDPKKPDDISTASTDDMFAFSQIIAGGQKVSAVTNAIEEENKNKDKKVDDEDMAVLAFSNTLPGNDDAPKVVETDESKKVAE